MPSGDSTLIDHERVLGISFFNGTPAEAVEHLKLTGGLAVMPAAPALIKLNYDTDYRLALQKADLALADSSLLVLLWKLARRRRLNKISGITYLKCLLRDCETACELEMLDCVRGSAVEERDPQHALMVN